jgi:hypothetical protein
MASGAKKEVMSLSPQLKQRILTAVRQEPAPVRRQVVMRTWALVAFAVALPLMGFWAAGGARQEGRPLAAILATTAGLVAIAALSLVVALGRGGQMVGRARVWLVAVALAAPLAFLLWKAGLSAEFPADPGHTRAGYRCLVLTFTFSLAPLYAMFFALRRSEPTHPRSLGLALGIGAGMSAATLVDLWCPVGHLSHLALGHVLPVAALGALGLGLGHVLLGLRRR